MLLRLMTSKELMIPIEFLGKRYILPAAGVLCDLTDSINPKPLAILIGCTSEGGIETIITHESIHFTLRKMGLHQESSSLDEVDNHKMGYVISNDYEG